MLLQLYLAQEANLDEDHRGGICVTLAALHPKSFYCFKAIEYMTRYWSNNKVSCLNAIILTLNNITEKNNLSIEYMNNPSLSLEEIHALLSNPPKTRAKDTNIFGLLPSNVQLIPAKSRAISKFSTRCQLVASKVARHAHSYQNEYLAICPKCFADHDGNTARMFGWECNACGKQLIDI